MERFSQASRAVRLAVVLILVAAGAFSIAFIAWHEPGQVSGSLTEVAQGAHGAYRVGAFAVELRTG